MEMPLAIFGTIFTLIFFGFSIYAVIIWLQSIPKAKTILKDANQHWSLKFVIYYGISFSIFLITVVCLAFIVVLSNFLLRAFNV